jgi:hypothetical protein
VQHREVLACAHKRHLDLTDSRVALTKRLVAAQTALINARALAEKLRATGRMAPTCEPTSACAPNGEIIFTPHFACQRPISSFSRCARISYRSILPHALASSRATVGPIPLNRQSLLATSDGTSPFHIHPPSRTSTVELGHGQCPRSGTAIALSDMPDIRAAAKAYKASVSAGLGLLPEKVCWFHEMPLDVGGGRSLSFSSTLSSPECCSSYCIAFIIMTFMYTLYSRLESVNGPATAQGVHNSQGILKIHARGNVRCIEFTHAFGVFALMTLSTRRVVMPL